jgi:hypothetical protein
MAKVQDLKVAELRERISDLKAQLDKVKTQREQWREKCAQSSSRLERLEGHPLAHLIHAYPLRPEVTPTLERFLHLLQTGGLPSYFGGDGLACWSRNVTALHTPQFKEAYKTGMNSGHKICRPKGSNLDIQIEWRAYMAIWSACHAARLPGDFVECGVNTGIYSLAICKYLDFNSLDKNFYLFDTFCGIPVEQMSEEERKVRITENEFYEECYELARSNFAPWPRCRLVRGTVPQTLTTVDIDKVCYLHVDMNIAAPERAALEHFWDKMVPGGVILFDDYGFDGFQEQYDSANEFAAQRGVTIATLPTGQGLLLKS